MTLLEPSSGQLLVDNYDIFDKKNIDLLNSYFVNGTCSTVVY